MMRQVFLRSLLSLAVVLVAAPPALAVIGTTDNVPAATLLLPYFEVSLDDETDVNTVMQITNASASAVLGHVTLWTDLGVPTYSYDIYLTGFDTATIDLRLLFHGIVTPSATNGQDLEPDDVISKQGPIS